MHKIKFKIFWKEESVEINLERLDTVFWITYIAISKDYYLLTEKDFLINPFNHEKVKVITWDYFEEKIRAWVPAHNEKDFEFAKKNNLEIKQVIAKDNKVPEVEKVREWFETLERYVIDIILENDKWEFLLQTETIWWITLTHFVWWWIDEWDSELETVSKELIEETWYTDFEIIWPINMSYCRSFAFRFTKQKNQDVLWRCFYIKLKSYNQIRSEVDDWKHTIKWVKEEEIIKNISWPTHLYMWDLFMKWDKYFSEKWILVNSWNFNRMESKKAEIELLELAKKNWFLIEENEISLILKDIKSNIKEYFLENYKILYIKKFFNWIKLHFYFHFKTTKATKFKKFQIYRIHFWINIWTEFSEKRPWIIFKSNKYIRWKDIVVLPITSLKKWKKYWDLDVFVNRTNKNNLSLDSVIKVEHIKSISKMRIWDYIWELDSDIINLLNQKIINMLLK